ncbi:Sec2p domain-containing protein [Aphelenchoides fujianensis]|nr:Sec2p domain-containing protein [Aphelenchoides fujianensis]
MRMVIGEMAACEKGEDVHLLHHEVHSLKAELADRTRQCNELLKTQRITDAHIADLTEQLFSEAYRMVDEQKALTRSAEMRLAEKQMIVDVLMVEVAALKAALVDLKLELKNARQSPDSSALSVDSGASSFACDPPATPQAAAAHRKPPADIPKAAAKEVPKKDEKKTPAGKWSGGKKPKCDAPKGRSA